MDYSFYLAPYDPAWKSKFEAEKSQLQPIFGPAALEIEHIGSTAIEGIPSKPIIDIAVMIESIRGVNRFVDGVAAIGYDASPLPGVHERLFARKGDPVEYHLSIAFSDVGSFWERQIMFRDYLRSSASARQEYAQLKVSTIRRDSSGRDGQYGEDGEAKTDFVERILRLAGFQQCQLYRGRPTREGARPRPKRSVTSVVVRDGYLLELTFDDGKVGSVDLRGIIKLHSDFGTARVADGTVEWDCGTSADVGGLYAAATDPCYPPTPEDGTA
ncbi:MAG: DUF2442 domain-containing protein [Gemmatimonadetes bacterium]|jgi:GrpB-like predicted nucleotidyltransferase (UPF0157 family)|nr:DUF2442 domain-containing protein [Gemmatimonadota bacterium]